jgi:GNAT superfamily N-acetyltransferase
MVIGLYAGVALAAYFLTPSTRLTTFLIGLVAVLATMTALRLDGRSQMRRLQEGDPHSLETHFVELDPEGIRTWCAHVDARYPWREFTKTTENNEFYLFVRPSGTGAAIPKRLLDDATESALRVHIREWAPDRGAGLAREVT